MAEKKAASKSAKKAPRKTATKKSAGTTAADVVDEQLARYRSMRDFKETAEPSGASGKSKAKSEGADGAQSLIREQVEMGVAVRMAVLEALARNIPNA